MSAIGSVTDIYIASVAIRPALPAGLNYARNLALKGEFPEANAAKTELTQVSPRPAAATATIVLSNLKLRLSLPLLYKSLLSH
jgi:hypothetical protein